ncbi:MAG: cupin domain-containing protein [Chloroflexota bacterium]|nr:MAG: cupin domain-containing protein [Chloroflexota bacterium]
MRLDRADPALPKGWYAGPWNSDLTVSVGYANEGIDEPHVHTRITEIYLVARGESVMRVGQESVALMPGDMLVIDPGEPHTFLSSLPGYFHFVFHIPGLSADEIRAERRSVTRSELGL